MELYRKTEDYQLNVATGEIKTNVRTSDRIYFTVYTTTNNQSLQISRDSGFGARPVFKDWHFHFS